MNQETEKPSNKYLDEINKFTYIIIGLVIFTVIIVFLHKYHLRSRSKQQIKKDNTQVIDGINGQIDELKERINRSKKEQKLIRKEMTLAK